MTRRTSRLRPSSSATEIQELSPVVDSSVASIGPYFTPSTVTPRASPASARSSIEPQARTR